MKYKETTNPLPEYVREKDILEAWGISSASFWRISKDPSFPQPKRIGKRLTCWPAEALKVWIEQQGEKPHEK